MSEDQNQQTETKGDQPGAQPQSNDAGSEPKTTPIIESANEAAKRLDEQNSRLERNLARLEQLNSNRILGGSSEAGRMPKSVEQLHKELVEEEAKKLLKDTGYF